MFTIIGKKLDLSQRRDFEKFGQKINRFGFNFAVCNIKGELELLCESGEFESNKNHLTKYAMHALSDNIKETDTKDVSVSRFGKEGKILSTVLKFGGVVPEFVALIDLGISEMSEYCVEPSIDNGNPAGMPHETTQANIEIFSTMLSLLAENFQAISKVTGQIEQISMELSHTYEELMLLHTLSTNMKVTKSDANFLQMACDRLTDIVTVEGIVMLQDKSVDDARHLTLVAGSGLLDVDEQLSACLYSRMESELDKGNDALLDSEVDSPFNYEWPDNIKNIIAVPLCGKDKVVTDSDGVVSDSRSIIGLMVAINRIGKEDFDSIDMKLFNSVANECAVFIENGRLFSDLKELFIGSLKALTNSIDAKDQYTHGHSERVAFISRWIAEQLAEEEQLTEEQINKVYLAGLLHDIGKIGINDNVLRKEGKLTEEEFNVIKTHPSIGSGILHEIKQMREVVPGVLCHHERVDGKGYPGGLSGDQIPLVGKIIAIADSFDAMTSRRTYRDAKTVQLALSEIEKVLGSQFDEKVGRAFIDSDVYRLWDIMQTGFTEDYGTSNFSEYGISAVGTLIE